MFEEKRREPKDYKKMAIKIAEISLVVLILLWGILLLVNYIRYTMELPPIIVVDKNTYDYEDGRVIEYIGLGYAYRIYDRDVASRIEFVPYWVDMKEYEITYEFPELREHSIPDNEDREDMVNNVIFYFDDNDEILFTYRCFNINGCEMAESVDGKYPMERFNNYVFIKEEYHEYEVVYIIDIDKKEIVYEVKDMKHSLITEFGYGMGNDGEFIVIDEHDKYGVLYLSDEIEIVAAPNFESISYNKQSDTYTMKSKYWMIKDLNNGNTLFTSEEILYDAFRIDGLLYMEYLVPRVLTDLEVLEGLTIDDFPKEYNVMDTSDYAKFDTNYADIDYHNNAFFLIDYDRYLHIKDVNGKDIISTPIKLDFDILDYDDREPYRVSTLNDKFIIETLSYNGRLEDTYIYDAITWERLN